MSVIEIKEIVWTVAAAVTAVMAFYYVFKESA